MFFTCSLICIIMKCYKHTVSSIHIMKTDETDAVPNFIISRSQWHILSLFVSPTIWQNYSDRLSLAGDGISLNTNVMCLQFIGISWLSLSRTYKLILHSNYRFLFRRYFYPWNEIKLNLGLIIHQCNGCSFAKTFKFNI